MEVVVLIVGSIGQLLNTKLVESHRVNEMLQGVSEEIKTLQGVVPIWSSCKNIRDDDGYWHRVEVYVRDHTHAEFSHGICPECAEKLYPVNPGNQ
jgi:ABC-type nickel/cobalt efflux system permease component RcnA